MSDVHIREFAGIAPRYIEQTLSLPMAAAAIAP